MKTRLIVTAGLLMASVMVTHAKKIKLTNAHVEVGINFDGTTWEWAASDETHGVEYDPEDVILLVEPGSKTTVPNSPNYSFLGVPGSDVWIVPQVIDPNLLTVGLSAEELPSGIFLDDKLDLRITGVDGPGEFALYEVSAFGVPEVFANTRDGLDANDHVPMFAGFHGHFNWAFFAPGNYRVTFEASGKLADGTPVSSGPQSYTFSVSHQKRPSRVKSPGQTQQRFNEAISVQRQLTSD